MATAHEMIAADKGGIVKEDVLPKLFKISPVERPFIDSIGSTTAHNPKKEFTDKILAQPSSTNTTYENEDLSSVVDNHYGNRYQNLCQNMRKSIKLSQRGRDVDTTYNEDEYLEQLMCAGDELRLDEEAAAVSRNAATAEVANTSGPLMAGAATWAIHDTNRGVSGADAVLDGAASNAGGGMPTTAPDPGEARGITLTMVKDTLRAGWNSGARFSHMMSTGDMIENIGSFFFTSTANVATMQTDVPQGNRTGADGGNGARGGGVVAQGAVNLFVGNFGTVILTPNRQMETYDSADGTPVQVVDVLFFDSRYPQMAYLGNYRTKEIANTGLYDQEVMHVDSTLVPGATHSISTIADINPLTAMIA